MGGIPTLNRHKWYGKHRQEQHGGFHSYGSACERRRDILCLFFFKLPTITPMSLPLVETTAADRTLVTVNKHQGHSPENPTECRSHVRPSDVAGE